MNVTKSALIALFVVLSMGQAMGSSITFDKFFRGIHNVLPAVVWGALCLEHTVNAISYARRIQSHIPMPLASSSSLSSNQGVNAFKPLENNELEENAKKHGVTNMVKKWSEKRNSHTTRAVLWGIVSALASIGCYFECRAL